MKTVLTEKDEIKIYILYLLRHINYALDFANINDIVMQDGFVNYFDFADAFAELLENGNVRVIHGQGKEETYAITEQGAHVADTLDYRLLTTVKDKGLKSALRLLDFKKRGAKVSCEVEELGGSKYNLHCRIAEGDEEVLCVKVQINDRMQMQTMRDNFNDKPEIVYRGVLALLSGEVNYLVR